MGASANARGWAGGTGIWEDSLLFPLVLRSGNFRFFDIPSVANEDKSNFFFFPVTVSCRKLDPYTFPWPQLV